MDEFENVFGKLVGGMLVSLTKALVDGGVPPTRAVGLCGPMVIIGAFGRKALLDLGVPKRTIQQWQTLSREALQDMDISVPPVAAINQALEAMDFPLRVAEK